MSKPPQIKDLGQSRPWMRMCVVAGTGFGKTVFSATAPNALHLVSDPEGTESAVSVLGPNTGNQEWAIDHIQNGDNSLAAAYEYLRAEGCNQFEWLIHDTVTAENGLAMDAAMEIMRKKPGGKQDKFIPDKPQYLRSQMQFWDMYKEFTGLPIHQIWLAWPRKMIVINPETEEEEEVWTAGIQNDYVSEKFLGNMKVIGYGHTFKKDDDTVRRMYFSQRGMYRGKDRTNSLGNFKDDLTVPRMMKIIEAKRSARSAARRTGAIPRPVKKTASRRRTA